MTIHLIGRRRVEDLAIAAADGALGDADSYALRTHLETCAECAALVREHERLAQRLASQVPSEAAQRVALDRIHAVDRQVSASWWSQAARRAAAAGFVLVTIVLGTGAVFGINEAVGRLQIPQRELVAEMTETLGGDAVILRVEDGRFAAGPNQTSGVLASADLQLSTPRTGSVELRFARRGESYGVLGGAPDLAGVTRLHIENRIEPVVAATIFEIWLHVEAPDPLDSKHIIVWVEPSHGGVRARLP